MFNMSGPLFEVIINDKELRVCDICNDDIHSKKYLKSAFYFEPLGGEKDTLAHTACFHCYYNIYAQLKRKKIYSE